MGKAEQKKKEKVAEDKTFGLKNKNRSSKVQAYVNSVKQNVDHRSPQERKSQAELQARRAAKEDKKAREAELAKLFNDVNAQQRKKREDEEAAAAAAQGEGDQFVYNPDEYLFRPEDFDEVEQDDTRLEEKLEAEREQLKDRTDLTPVTEETFQAWKRKKREEAAAAEAARVRRAKAGEGKMRGWDLWQMDQELFVDDADADEFYEREEMNAALEEDKEEDDDEAAYDLS